MKRLLGLGILLAGLAGTSLWGQDAEVPDAGDPPPAAAEEAVSLFLQTLPMEIDTATYYELLEWVKREGLDPSGDRSVLQNRLYEHYKVKAPLPKDTAKQDKKVTIHSAGAAEYFSIEVVDEDYIILTGSVKLVLEDQKESVTHTITAQKITFNQTLNSLTAQGDVVYTMTKQNSSEVFRGQSLSFNLNDWNGMFFDGISQRDRKVGNVTLPFFFKGETIERSGEDVIILEEGVITSSNPKDPYYRIQAKKIWILAPGEWGWQDATLYIGRVPVFYIPFYFQPGDEMFFNPVLGLPSALERRGSFLQTTTYLYGRKTKESSPLSFLQITEGEDPNVEQEIRGLYLVRKALQTPPLTVASETAALPNTKDWVFKILGDLYVNLGVYSGLDVSLPGWMGFSTFKLSGGLALSRNIYYSNGVYTPYGPDPLDTSLDLLTQEHWNRSWLWGLELPFRYAFDVDLALNSFTLKAEYYSDPFMLYDFRDRSENFSMLSFIGFGGDQVASTQSEKITMNWRTSATVSPTVTALSPWIKSLNIQTLEFLLDFGTKDNNLVTESVDKTYINGRPPDPTSKFFYPTRFVTPNLRFSVSGDLFSWGLTPAQTPTGEAGLPKILLPPWGDEAPIEKDAGGEAAPPPPAQEPPLLTVPPPLANESWVPSSVVNTLGVTYNLTPTTSIDSNFNSDDWNNPQEISYEVKNSTFKASLEGNVGANLKFLSDIVSLANTVTFKSGIWNTEPWLDTLSETELDAFRLADAQSTTVRVVDALTFTLKPFTWYTPLSGSTMTYNLTSRLWERKYNSYDAVSNTPSWDWYFPEWTADAISVHRWDASLVYVPLKLTNASLTLGLTTNGTLEPRIPEQSLSYSIAGQWEWVKLTNSGGWKYTNLWTPDPITGTLELKPLQDLSLVSSFELNGETGELRKNSYELRWLTFFTRLNLNKSIPYFFNSDPGVRNWEEGFSDGSWVPGQEVFQFQDVSAGYDLKLVNQRLWRNRILLEGNANTQMSMNLRQFTTSSLSFNLNLTLKIMDLLDITIHQTSSNTALYRYIPGLTESLNMGASTLNIFEDILKSFNFFNEQDRRDSFFNLNSLGLTLKHYMDDWTLEFKYTGFPTKNSTVVPNRFEWTNEFSFIIQWLPIPEIRSDVKIDRDANITIKTDEKS